MSAELSKTTMSADYKPYVVVRSKFQFTCDSLGVNLYMVGTSPACAIPTSGNCNDGVAII